MFWKFTPEHLEFWGWVRLRFCSKIAGEILLVMVSKNSPPLSPGSSYVKWLLESSLFLLLLLVATCCIDFNILNPSLWLVPCPSDSIPNLSYIYHWSYPNPCLFSAPYTLFAVSTLCFIFRSLNHARLYLPCGLSLNSSEVTLANGIRVWRVTLRDTGRGVTYSSVPCLLFTGHSSVPESTLREKRRKTDHRHCDHSNCSWMRGTTHASTEEEIQDKISLFSEGWRIGPCSCLLVLDFANFEIFWLMH